MAYKKDYFIIITSQDMDLSNGILITIIRHVVDVSHLVSVRHG